MTEPDKWQLLVSLFNNTILDVRWSIERPAPPEDAETDEAPGPITEKVSPPSTAFGLAGNANPNAVHRRPTIK